MVSITLDIFPRPFGIEHGLGARPISGENRLGNFRPELAINSVPVI
jgi:hypothetical protein